MKKIFYLLLISFCFTNCNSPLKPNESNEEIITNSKKILVYNDNNLKAIFYEFYYNGHYYFTSYENNVLHSPSCPCYTNPLNKLNY